MLALLTDELLSEVYIIMRDRSSYLLTVRNRVEQLFIGAAGRRERSCRGDGGRPSRSRSVIRRGQQPRVLQLDGPQRGRLQRLLPVVRIGRMRLSAGQAADHGGHRRSRSRSRGRDRGRLRGGRR